METKVANNTTCYLFIYWTKNVTSHGFTFSVVFLPQKITSIILIHLWICCDLWLCCFVISCMNHNHCFIMCNDSWSSMTMFHNFAWFFFIITCLNFTHAVKQQYVHQASCCVNSAYFSFRYQKQNRSKIEFRIDPNIQVEKGDLHAHWTWWILSCWDLIVANQLEYC